MDTKGGWSVGAAGLVQQPDCVGVESRGRGAGPVPPWHKRRLCRIHLPFILFSIMSSIILWLISILKLLSLYPIDPLRSSFSFNKTCRFIKTPSFMITRSQGLAVTANVLFVRRRSWSEASDEGKLIIQIIYWKFLLWSVRRLFSIRSPAGTVEPYKIHRKHD